MDYNIDVYRTWLQDNVTLSNADSNTALRALTQHILMGRNYRLLTEKNTKEKLLLTYLWIMDVINTAKNEYGDEWHRQLLANIQGTRRKTAEQKNLMYWLLGITSKTATNLGIGPNDFATVLNELIVHVNTLFDRVERPETVDMAWLLLIGGAATLNIRGSDKSKIGKQLEKVVIKSMLTILGFVENESFWVNIGRDDEVGREADAEVLTRRGRVRIEVGLIASGNQEVIEDKIGRLGRNDIVLYDVVGPRSRIHATAQDARVNLVQIRNSEPLAHLHRLLQPIVAFEMNPVPHTEEEINLAVSQLPDAIFDMINLASVDDNE